MTPGSFAKGQVIYNPPGDAVVGTSSRLTSTTDTKGQITSYSYLNPSISLADHFLHAPEEVEARPDYIAEHKGPAH